MKGLRKRGEPGELAGKTVLVTGGARRVGAAICRRLHRAGANVMMHYRTSHRDAMRLRRGLEAERPNSVACVAADLLHHTELAALVQSALDHFGRLDALVNNASSFYATPFGHITLRDWTDLIGTNLQAPLFLSQAAAPELTRRRGAIVNIADIHADRPLEGHVTYSIAKAGLVALTRSLARELGPHVRVNAVAPGAIAWPEEGILAEPLVQADIVARTPLRRIGSIDDIASAVHYLLTAPFITGQVLAVDGGRSVVM
ncbi:MAG: pteridine reductase [Betaproteobacteria bacterium]|nr:MAG: pteridine reductase [Betaproteobacteria bacterium]